MEPSTSPSGAQRRCWCGVDALTAYSPEYLACEACGTLVSRVGLTDEQVPVHNDEESYYGKGYWLSHQQHDLGLPDIHARARADLAERCVHWLSTLLPYKPPPARILEVGCGHGGFVALMRWAGYDAVGLEVSPWVVEMGRQTFDVPLLLGPLEQQQLPPGSFDAVVLNDVLEHLPDPLATLRNAIALLKPDGLLLMQTPAYPEGTTFEELTASNDLFLHMMTGPVCVQHLYLFSRRSVHRLLEKLGLPALAHEPALFRHDMYVVAGKQTPVRQEMDQARAALLAHPSGRLVQALLDLYQRQQAAEASRQGFEEEAQARLDMIELLHSKLEESEADRAARLQIMLRLEELRKELEARCQSYEQRLNRLPIKVFERAQKMLRLKRAS